MIAPVGQAQTWMVNPIAPASFFRPPAAGPAGGAAPAAAVAQISDLARSLLSRADALGAAVGSSGQLDLHLDLEELGVRVDAAGRQDARARSLSIDLHVTSRSGTVDLGDRQVQFEELRVELSVTQVEARAVSGDAERGDPRRRLTEALRGLIGLLHDAGQGGKVGAADVDSLQALFGEDGNQLREFLKAIVEALQSLARPDSALPGQSNAATQQYEREELRVEVQMMSASFAGAPGVALGAEAAASKAA